MGKGREINRKHAQCGKRDGLTTLALCGDLWCGFEVKLETEASNLGGRGDHERMSKMRASERKLAAGQHHLPHPTLHENIMDGDWMWSRETKGQ
jgi:hypothetical protein